MRTYQRILNQQLTWAKEQGIEIDGGYTRMLKDNLFVPLSPYSEDEFKAGKGNELGEETNKGKMLALHSSSALVVNVFEFWRNRNTAIIAQLCGASKGTTSLHFERKYPTGVGKEPAHLDVEFSGIATVPLAIESKFTESYSRKTKRHISEKYLDSDIWQGLPCCESLVRRIYKEQTRKTSFPFLDIPQLLKHILGLTRKHGKRGFILLYLWYNYHPSLEAEKHRLEIREFERGISSDAVFRYMTYQELFKKIRKSREASTYYIDYLATRYFNSISAD
jgi:hypothetical protein